MSVISSHSSQVSWFGQNGRLQANRWRLTIVFAILALFAWNAEMREIVVTAMAEAYFQVTVFVAATLALVFAFERAFAFDLGDFMRRNLRWQPLIASALGALPGCGGAIIVVTQFTKGQASFGAFIAVLVATMGDAAFLLMAQDFSAFLIIMGISLVAGTLTGILVDWVHGRNYMAVQQREHAPAGPADTVRLPELPFRRIWIALAGFGLVPAIFIAASFDENTVFTVFFGAETGIGTLLGFACALFCICLWSISKRPNDRGIGADTRPEDGLMSRVIKDTNFVTAWVILAFLFYEIAAGYFGLDIGTLFKNVAILLPVIAVLVGFIPGCGPQIVVTSLYLAGAVPLSTQISNAMANDGDALFPALALAPKAAVFATLYSGIPAIIIGYAWLFFFEF